MLKLHWKKILLSAYVVVVLIVSASVKAEVQVSSLNKAQNLKAELKKLSSEIAFMKDRGLLSVNSTIPTSNDIQAEPLTMYGQFLIKESFEGQSTVYFVENNKSQYYEVNLDSIHNSNISTQDLYQVSGFVAKPAPGKPQLTPSFIVTSVKLQR